jgi:cytochrome c-type biogenesis protein CcmH/NrfG
MKQNVIMLTFVGVCLLVGLLAAINLLSPRTAADVDAIAAANALYDDGNYAAAARVYEQLVAQNVQDSRLFYNLGNIYLRQGDLGHAILNYQRAIRLAPRDADIKANLELARSQAVDIFPDEANGPVNGLANTTSNWLTLN